MSVRLLCPRCGAALAPAFGRLLCPRLNACGRGGLVEHAGLLHPLASLGAQTGVEA